MVDDFICMYNFCTIHFQEMTSFQVYSKGFQVDTAFIIRPCKRACYFSRGGDWYISRIYCIDWEIMKSNITQVVFLVIFRRQFLSLNSLFGFIVCCTYNISSTKLWIIYQLGSLRLGSGSSSDRWIWCEVVKWPTFGYPGPGLWDEKPGDNSKQGATKRSLCW